MTNHLEVVANFHCHTGEGPLWHPEEKKLYWTDIPNSKIFSYDPATNQTETFNTDMPVGGFTLHEDGRLLLFMAEGAVKLWHRDRMETMIDSLPEEHGNRFNDVIADPEGRIFCGVMSTPKRAGRLYRLDPNGKISVIIENTGTANGMGFSPDLKTMYFCDSGKSEIYAFDYNRQDGTLSNMRTIVKATPADGKPDGMTVDAEGLLWSARWNGYCLIRHKPDGTEIHRIKFPVKNISCVAFGGSDYTDMYVTTAGGHNTAENGPLAGSLFRLNIGIKGRPEFRSRIHPR